MGFLGSATYAFLPELVRKYKAQFPGVKLTLQELTPLQQETAFDKGEIDIGFTRTLSAEQSQTFSSRCLYRDPMMESIGHPASVSRFDRRERCLDKGESRSPSAQLTSFLPHWHHIVTKTFDRTAFGSTLLRVCLRLVDVR